MLWKEVKSWCKTNGYKTDRTKVENEENSYHYTWSKLDDPAVCGTSTSVSKLATIIYNQITNNIHLEYQQKYAEEQSKQDSVIYDKGF
jgi:hypothetical protein